VIPALIDFQPDMIFLSCGLDGHRKDEMNHGFVSLQVRSFVCLVCLVLLVLLSLVSLLFFIFHWPFRCPHFLFIFFHFLPFAFRCRKLTTSG